MGSVEMVGACECVGADDGDVEIVGDELGAPVGMDERLGGLAGLVGLAGPVGLEGVRLARRAC